ncbi:hypothetical protein B0H19DRAFT_1145233 [Mycena capillaripes]|nr:hypothetical protein B0H19DRAFT_1145233 [Mycena capillaripes]
MLIAPFGYRAFPRFFKFQILWIIDSWICIVQTVQGFKIRQVKKITGVVIFNFVDRPISCHKIPARICYEYSSGKHPGPTRRETSNKYRRRDLLVVPVG